MREKKSERKQQMPTGREEFNQRRVSNQREPRLHHSQWPHQKRLSSYSSPSSGCLSSFRWGLIPWLASVLGLLLLRHHSMLTLLFSLSVSFLPSVYSCLPQSTQTNSPICSIIVLCSSNTTTAAHVYPVIRVAHLGVSIRLLTTNTHRVDGIQQQQAAAYCIDSYTIVRAACRYNLSLIIMGA